MILYHFTSARHLRPISRYGLTVGDVPTDLDRWRGRIGVWLTSSSVPYGHGLEGSTGEKGAYRLSVSVADDSPLLQSLGRLGTQKRDARYNQAAA
jgi:hypothetical protein